MHTIYIFSNIESFREKKVVSLHIVVMLQVGCSSFDLLKGVNPAITKTRALILDIRPITNICYVK